MNQLTTTKRNTPAFTQLPVIIQQAGDHASKRFIEFFTANIRNPHTRLAYARAVAQFMHWCETSSLSLQSIEPVHVAAYIESLGTKVSIATVKQHLAALRALFDYLVVGQVIPFNPAAAVRGPKQVVKIGKTPVMDQEQAKALIDSIHLDLIGLRDRALIGLMLYSWARVSAVIAMQVQDYYPGSFKRWKIRLQEKGGQYRELPVHHKAEIYLDEYLEESGIREEKKSPLFRSMKYQQLQPGGLTRDGVLKMIRKRSVGAGLPKEIKFGCHSLRGTGLTLFRQEGGSLEMAQQIAGHADTKTTKLYDRTDQTVELEEIERIRI